MSTSFSVCSVFVCKRFNISLRYSHVYPWQELVLFPLCSAYSSKYAPCLFYVVHMRMLCFLHFIARTCSLNRVLNECSVRPTYCIGQFLDSNLYIPQFLSSCL
jgi:hypothetical protein